MRADAVSRTRYQLPRACRRARVRLERAEFELHPVGTRRAQRLHEAAACGDRGPPRSRRCPGPPARQRYIRRPSGKQVVQRVEDAVRLTGPTSSLHSSCCMSWSKMMRCKTFGHSLGPRGRERRRRTKSPESQVFGVKAADESGCTPGSVPRSLARASVTAIHLGPALPPASCGLPADSGGQPSNVRAEHVLPCSF